MAETMNNAGKHDNWWSYWWAYLKPNDLKCSFAVSGFLSARLKKAIPRVRRKDDVDRNY